jgi:hypothetical protein
MTVITARSPKNKRERLIAALNSTDDDLYPDCGRIIVTGRNLEGELIYLGEMSESIPYLKNSPFRQILSEIRFGGNR